MSASEEARQGSDRILAEAGIEAPAEPTEKVSAAAILSRYAMERYSLHRDGYDEPYALPREGPRIARYFRGSRSLRAELASAYLAEHKKPASGQALADTLGAIEGFALAAATRETYLRVATVGDDVYMDLGRDDGKAVHVTAGAWHVVDTAPVVWRRTRKTRELPYPVKAENGLDALWAIARVSAEEQPLVMAWQVCAVLDLVTPILDVIGEHGSGKTSVARAIAGAIDTAEPSTVPGNALDLVVGAHARRVTILDNLTNVQPWLSDALCRLVTGDELDRRALYTDSDVAVLKLRRPLITTSIDVGAVAPDYADRQVKVHIPVLSESKGLSEKKWAAKWELARPGILAAILDLTADVLTFLPDIELDLTPRMGDYSEVLAAVDKVLGTTGLDAYRAQRGKASADSVESDLAGSRLIAWLGKLRLPEGQEAWEGSMSDLYAALTPDPEPHGWPRNPRALQARLAKLGPPLRRVGVDVELTDTKDAVTRRSVWRIASREVAPAPPFDPSDPTESAPSLPERPEGSSEGLHARSPDPSEPFADDVPSDLRINNAKGPKGPTGTSALADTDACARHATTGFGPRAHCPDCEALTDHGQDPAA